MTKQPLPPGPQDLPRDYGPDGAAGGLSRSTPRRADDTTTRLRERADASVQRPGLGARLLVTSDEARAEWCLADYSAFLFRAQVADIGQDLNDSKESSSTTTLEEVDVTFESVIKEAVAFATSSAITHIPCAVLSFASNREGLD